MNYYWGMFMRTNKIFATSDSVPVRVFRQGGIKFFDEHLLIFAGEGALKELVQPFFEQPPWNV